MKYLCAILAAIAIGSVGCTESNDYDELVHESQERSADTRPVKNKRPFNSKEFTENTGMASEIIGGIIGLGWLEHFFSSYESTEAADYSPTAERKDVRGR